LRSKSKRGTASTTEEESESLHASFATFAHQLLTKGVCAAGNNWSDCSCLVRSPSPRSSDGAGATGKSEAGDADDSTVLLLDEAGSAGQGGPGRDTTGKFVFALGPRNLIAAASYARAASSAVLKVPSQTRVFFDGSRISAAYRPHGLLRTPLKCVSCLAAATAAAGGMFDDLVFGAMTGLNNWCGVNRERSCVEWVAEMSRKKR
jgi:hypothetical protein